MLILLCDKLSYLLHKYICANILFTYIYLLIICTAYKLHNYFLVAHHRNDAVIMEKNHDVAVLFRQ